jgi:hypothetical protein
MMKTIKLECWSVTQGDVRYIAPEHRTSRVQGVVQDHPCFPRDAKIVSSPIDQVEGRIVTTRSGTRYQLGRIDPQYRAYLKRNGYPYDPHNPVAIVDRYTRMDVE